jgi:hypothetical protein
VLAPAGLYAFALARMPDQMTRAIEMLESQQIGQVPDPAAMFQGQALEALIGWLPLILVVIAGVLKSTAGPNRFGEAPVSF